MDSSAATKQTVSSAGCNPKGRPRKFDLDQALDAAMRVFWQNGYEGASLPDLTRAMGINRPSMYAAFGNKESLFRKVLDRYQRGMGAVLSGALDQPRVRDAVSQLLTAPSATAACTNPHGCLLVNAAIACTKESEAVRQELVARRDQIERLVHQRLVRAVDEGEMHPTTDVKALAKFIATFNNGLAVQRKGNAARGDLLAAADLAMQTVDSALTRKGRRKPA